MSDVQLDYYKKLILDHNKNPRNYGKPTAFQHSAEGYNPLCGDKIQLYVSTDEQGRLIDLFFESQACALCKASTSLMSEVIRGKQAAAVEEFGNKVTAMLQGKPFKVEDIAPLDVFSSVASYPARAKCVLLPWTTIKKAMGEIA